MAVNRSKTGVQFNDEGEISDNGKEDRSIDGRNMEFGEDMEEVRLFKLLKEMVGEIFHTKDQMPLIQRIKRALEKRGPILKQAMKDSTENLVRWMHRGGPWRSLLVVSVGMILLLAFTGLSAFMLFFLAATIYTIVIGFLLSLATVGGFMVIFFFCLTAIYVGALSIAAFVISIMTLVTISTVAIAAGWIGFFWLVWQGLRKILNIARDSLVMTASALSTISTSRAQRLLNLHERARSREE
eukprot:Gb_27102 [translate_table: standard]